MPDSAPTNPSPPGSANGNASPPPWRWLLAFLIIFIVFAALVVILIAQHQSPQVALGVPATLSTAAVVVLFRIARLARSRGDRPGSPSEQPEIVPEIRPDSPDGTTTLGSTTPEPAGGSPSAD